MDVIGKPWLCYLGNDAGTLVNNERHSISNLVGSVPLGKVVETVTADQ